MQQQQIPQQQVVYQQPGVNIVTQGAAARPDEFTASALTQMKGLSFTQMLMGALCVVFGIVLICLEVADDSYYGSDGYSFSGYGIWVGAYYLIVGGIGIGAVRKNNSCWIISAMVLNIISAAMFWIILTTFASIGLGLTSASSCNSIFYYSYCYSNGTTNAFLAMDSLLLIIAMIQLVVAIWSSVLCCGAMCSCCKPATPGQTIQYTATHVVQGQPGVVYATPGQSAQYSPYPVQPQMAVQGQYPAYPAQQPVGYAAQPQAPPSYYSSNQSEAVSNPGYSVPSQTVPASADPTKQQQPTYP